MDGSWSVVHLHKIMKVSWVWFSPLTNFVTGGTSGMIQQRCSSRLSAGGPCEQLWHGKGCPLFDVVHPASRCPEGWFWRCCHGEWHEGKGFRNNDRRREVVSQVVSQVVSHHSGLASGVVLYQSVCVYSIEVSLFFCNYRDGILKLQVNGPLLMCVCVWGGGEGVCL